MAAGTNSGDAGRRCARHHQAAGGGQGGQLVARHRRRSDRRRRRRRARPHHHRQAGTAPPSARFSRPCSTWGRRSTCSTPRRGRRSPPTRWPRGRTGSTTPSSSTSGDLSVGGGSAFTDAEWTALTTYEVEFGVRRVSLYTSPNASYGLVDNDVGVDPDDGADLGELHGRREGALHRDQLRQPRRDQPGLRLSDDRARQRDDPAARRRERKRLRRDAAATPTGARRWRSPSVRRRPTSRISSSPTAS